ncbi:thiazole synthase [Mesoterricola sediminis]|uniref:Thiazole synthase n=1 Tax=Mesoterricola sediminis TaxID=2927980 RepID=A0AA48GVZ3_9BACT|nr:thiazole synthase [Mesoterricola sediminis]BDU75077.1 thiazole synthase [Mesoterricola sediminis]
MLTIAGRTFENRLVLGTGKYKDFATMKACYEAARVEMVTLAVRRFDLSAQGEDNILNWIPKGMALLPNTAGCYTREDALRVSRLAREALDTPWIKLEVIGDPTSLYPDGEETLRAAEELVKEGFVVLPYLNADPILARKLCDVGVAAIMPLGSAIGSGLGVQNPYVIQIIREIAASYGLPLVVDAGVGTASDAAVAMELGADAVLLNTAVAEAADPVRMARAMDHAVQAGRLAFEAGRMPKRLYASASSPVAGVVGRN